MPERPHDEQLEHSTNQWLRWGLILIVLAVLAFPAYRLYEPANREASRENLLTSLATQGEHLFALNCSACHGADGLGGVGPALNSEQFLTTVDDEQVAPLIAVGIPGTDMSAYSLDFGGPLTLEQIDALTKYLRSLEEFAPDFPGWRAPLENEPVAFPVPPTIATTTTTEPTGEVPEPGEGGLVAQGEAVYEASCAVCHGADLGGGVGPALGAGSVVAGQDDATVSDVIVNGRASMPAWEGVLSAEDIEAVIAFIRREQG
jgi:mono/diheme cytochrome c family protein